MEIVGRGERKKRAKRNSISSGPFRDSVNSSCFFFSDCVAASWTTFCSLSYTFLLSSDQHQHYHQHQGSPPHQQHQPLQQDAAQFPVPKVENVYESWKPVDHGHPLRDATVFYSPPTLERVRIEGTRYVEEKNNKVLHRRYLTLSISWTVIPLPGRTTAPPPPPFETLPEAAAETSPSPPPCPGSSSQQRPRRGRRQRPIQCTGRPTSITPGICFKKTSFTF